MFARAALVIATTLAVASASVLVRAPACARSYTVVAGDNCDIISAKTSTSTYQLAAANPDKINEQCTDLTVGEVLCLGFVGQDCNDVHVVQSDDVCVDIANEAGTTLSILLANNPNVDSTCSNIYPGEVLCTADKIIPYTSA
ncbi:carbohydrate-binding module family 50 protein [Trametes sanguinea]|nr:carbohydrate-binding module family 50 protein [Trametes sanguinea]